MKNIIERIVGGGAKIASYLPKAVSTRLLVLALGLGLVSTAWAVAPTPTAVWESGQFEEAASLHGGYSISLNGNNVVNDKIVISSAATKGVTIDIEGVLGDTSGRDVSVLIKYSGAKAPASQAVFVCNYSYKDSGEYDTGLASKEANSGALKGYWNTTMSYPMKTNGADVYPTVTDNNGSGYLLFSYKHKTENGITKGVYGYNGPSIATMTGGSNDGLCWPDRYLSKVAIGGPSGEVSSYGVWPDLVIEGIAIFVNKTYTNSDLAAYVFPSDYDYVATISANTSLSDITTWTKGSGTPGTGSKVCITTENGAVLTVSGTLDCEVLNVLGDGSIALANGANISSTIISGVDMNIAASTEVTVSNSSILTKVGCSGKLITNGDVKLLDSGNNFAYGSEIYVATGTATVNAYFGAYNSAGRGLHGNITIAKGAKFVNSRTESFDCNADANHPVVVDVSGTLSLGSTRWTLGNNNRIVLHEGGRVEGDGDSSSNGAFDLENSVTGFTIEADGNAEFAALVRIRDTATLNVDVAAGKTLTFSTKGFVTTSGKLIKTGDGTLANTINSSYTGLTTVSAGRIESTSFPSGNVSIGNGATFTLKNVGWTAQPSRFSGEGTLELYNDRGNLQHCIHTVTGVTFSGTLKFTATNTDYYGSGHLISNVGFLSSEVRPQLELNTLTGVYSKLFFDTIFNEQTIAVRDLKGTGHLSAKASGGSAQNQTLETKQTQNTEFSGNLVTDDTPNKDAEHKTNLRVIGDDSGSIKTLTISGENTSVGELSVSNGAKVSFASTGSWASGTVTVGNGGWLESTNSSVMTSLTLTDGANIVFPTASSSLTGITSLTFASGTATISIPEDVKHANGTLIDWSAVGAAPTGTFQLDTDTARKYFISADALGLSITAAAARIGDTPYSAVDSAIEYLASDRDATVVVLDDTWEETDSQYYSALGTMGILWNGTSRTYSYAEAYVGTPPVYHPTIAEALSAAASGEAKTVYLFKNLAADPVLPAGVSLNLGNYTLTGTVTTSDGNVVGQSIVNGKTVYTSYANSISETWTDASGDHSWNTAGNWDKGFVPLATTPVTFPASVDGWTIGIPGHAGAEKCASMTLNGDVTFQRGGGDWAKLCVYGAISGSGTLTLNQTCIENDSGSVITIPGPVAIVGSNDSAFLGANGWTISGNLSVGGYFKTQIPITVTGNAVFAASGAKVETQSAITITGTTTLNGDFSRDTTYGDAQLTFGDVTVAASTAITGAKPTTFSGTVTLASGATLTVPTATTTVSGATFATSVADSYVKATEDGSTTIYSVAAKRTVTVSTDAHSSVTGVTNEQKFVPGDVLTITASADEYYTATLTVGGATQTSPYELTTTDADVTVAVTAVRDTVTVTIPTIPEHASVSVSFVSGGEGHTATTAGDITVDAGTDVTATWTADSGYTITAGASQTLSAVTSAQTLTAPTVEAVSQEATVSNVSFSPSANGKATVTATITGPAATATLTYGGSQYDANVVNGSVTFENVSVGQTSDSYFAPTEYSLTTDAGQTTGQTSGLVDGTSWINENATTHVGGAWTNDVYYVNNKATIKDNRFEATSAAPTAAGGLVVLTMNVNFPTFSDAMVDGDAQGAITLREVNDTPTFSVLTTNESGKVWTDVTGAGSVNTNIDYVITLTFNYAANKYTAAVGGTTLSAAGGVSEFDILKNASSVQNIDFVGEGVLEYLKGDVAAEGAMVDDGNGTKYATVDAAIAAYNADKTIRPLTMLHPGSVPSGWKVVNGIISKIIKGWKLIAY